MEQVIASTQLLDFHWLIWNVEFLKLLSVQYGRNGELERLTSNISDYFSEIVVHRRAVALTKLRIPHKLAMQISKRHKYPSLISNEECQGYKSWNELLYLYD